VLHARILRGAARKIRSHRNLASPLVSEGGVRGLAHPLSGYRPIARSSHEARTLAVYPQICRTPLRGSLDLVFLLPTTGRCRERRMRIVCSGIAVTIAFLIGLSFPSTAFSAEATPVQATPRVDIDLLAHGRYLSKIARCNDCHTPIRSLPRPSRGVRTKLSGLLPMRVDRQTPDPGDRRDRLGGITPFKKDGEISVAQTMPVALDASSFSVQSVLRR
jgi:hypothetical protein